MGRVSLHAISRWSRLPGWCGFRCVIGCGAISCFFSCFLFERTRPAASMRPLCFIYLSTSTRVALLRLHVLVCITSKVTRPENDMVLVLASKLTWCYLGGNRRDFSVGDRSWLDFSVGIRIDLVLCGGRKWLSLESGWQLTWFWCRGHAKLTCS